MVICGHQFHAGDESDWILSTSASFLMGGSTTAKKILEELFKKHCGKMTNKSTGIRRQKAILALRKNSSDSMPNICRHFEDCKSPQEGKKEETKMTANKVLSLYNFEDFDESQHLNGCPMKWLYNKKLLEKNKMYKVSRWCSKKSVKKEESRKEKCKNFGYETPKEVKIHKINLTAKYSCSNDENYLPSCRQSPARRLEPNFKSIEPQKKKLGSKNNNDGGDTSSHLSETSSELSSRHNYLPPRPLLGLNPLLSLLLSPQQDTTCCTVEDYLQQNNTREERVKSASLSIKSLNLPLTPPESKPLFGTKNTPPRWGSKSSRLPKKLQVPNQVTINLRQNAKTTETKPEVAIKPHHNPPVKKSNEKTNPPRSLSSLFYELSDKTNYRNQSQEYFDDIIRDLTMRDDQFKIQRFLHFNYTARDRLDSAVKNKHCEEKKTKAIKNEATDDTELNLMCGKVRFFEKLPDPKKQEEHASKRKVRL